MLGYLEPNQVTVVVMGKLGQPMLGYHENEREKERKKKKKEGKRAIIYMKFTVGFILLIFVLIFKY